MCIRDSRDNAVALSDALTKLNVYHILEWKNGYYQIRIEWYQDQSRAKALSYLLSNKVYAGIYTA